VPDVTWALAGTEKPKTNRMSMAQTVADSASCTERVTTLLTETERLGAIAMLNKLNLQKVKQKRPEA
jgi:hypothetical protein